MADRQARDAANRPSRSGSARHGFRIDKVGDGKSLLTRFGGVTQTDRRYKNLAFVELPVGQNSTFKIPVAILGDRIVVCKIPIKEGMKELGELAIRLDRLKRRIGDALQTTSNFFRNLQPELQLSQDRALKLAKDGRDTLRTELASLEAERQAIRKEVEKLAKGQKLDFGNTDELVKGLSSRREQLDEWIAKVEASVKEANDPTTIKAKERIIAAQSLEQLKQDFDSSASLYEQLLQRV